MAASTESPKFFLIAGEASGDQLGAPLITALKQQLPQAEFYGMGGQHMQQAGMHLLMDYEQLAIIGLLDVLKNLKLLKRTFKFLEEQLLKIKPDAVILIDYPGFNLRFARIAKQHGFKVIDYVSPQIWAWRYGRIKKIKRDVDLMLVLLPFEEAIYQKEGVPVKYVGHPKAAKITAPFARDYARFQLDPTRPIFGLLPGSRRSEIERHMPLLRDTIPFIKQHYPNAQFVIPLADNLSPQSLATYLTDDMQVIEHHTYDVIPLCDAIIASSGTVTLEIALFQVPLVIIYKVAAFNYWLGRMIINAKQLGLCNIIAEETIAPEFIQYAAKPKALSNALLDVMQRRSEISNQMSRLHERLHVGDSSQLAAEAICQSLS